MLVLLSVLLLSSHVLFVDQSKVCNEKTEYLENEQCCKKCEPGHLMIEKCGPNSPNTKCVICGEGYFMSYYNINFRWCDSCKPCSKEHMKYEKRCTITSNAVCTCEDGYRCSDNNCETCVKIQKTTTSPPNMPSTNIPVASNNNMWISVNLCLACVCLCILFTCLILTSRHAQPCGWIMSASAGLWNKKTHSLSSQCTEEEEVPMPVQEMCGKTEKMEDV